MSRDPGWRNVSSDANVAQPMRRNPARALVHSVLSTQAPLRERFQACTDALVRHMDAAAARIWVVLPHRHTLTLQANSGARTTPGGGGPHIPAASPALRSILESGAPYITHDAVNDPHLRGLDWAPGEHIAYAGFPLLVGAQTVGVVALFSRKPIGPVLETLRMVASMIAGAIQRTYGDKALHRSDPFSTETQLLNSLLFDLRHVIDHTPFALAHRVEMQLLRDRYASLSHRERDVMALVVAGHLNKQVGAQLGISEITVKAHRGQVMRKMNAFSLADLVKIAVLLQLAPAPEG
jgi:DNA-binding CsgD family transcriptional regulator